MILKQKLILIALLFLILIGCSKKEKEEKVEFISVHNKTYYEKEYIEFMQMRFIYPVIKKSYVFPGKKYDPTLFAETIVLNEEAKKSEKLYKDNYEYNKIKEFFKGLYYQKAVIIRNMGFTDQELKDYFNEKEKEKSGYFGDPYFEVIRDKVADELFLKTYEPDSSIKNYFKEIDDKSLQKIWLSEVKKDIPKFFREYYYKKYYGKKYPQSPNKILGEEGLVVDSIVDMAISWLPKSQNYDKKSFRLKIANKLIATDLFIKEAESRGWYNEKFNKRILKWFNMYHRVNYYINNVLVNKSNLNYKVDSSDIYFKYIEDKIEGSFDSYLNNYNDSLKGFSGKVFVNQYIKSKREKAKLVFIKEHIADDFVYSIEEINNKVNEAKNKRDNLQVEKYISIINDELYYESNGVGYKLLGEHYYDIGEYSKSILAFRSYILSNPSDKEKRDAYNLIGYMYDELDDNENAYINYKWILKKFPGTPAAEDAEFAMLHLGEPLLEPEEYALETKRQGQ